MPQIDVSGYEPTDALALIAQHLFERLDTLNTILGAIADRLDGIEQRMSYAKVLDSDD